MAKKAATKRDVTPKQKPKGRRKQGPRSQILPGTSAARDQKLDNFCEEIAEERGRMATARKHEQQAISSAQTRMLDKAYDFYRHAGVELALIPGDMKLRARLVEDQSDMAIKKGGKFSEDPAAPKLSTTARSDEDDDSAGQDDAGEEIDDEEVPF